MSTTVFLTKCGNALMPSDSLSQELLDKIPDGKAVKAEITVPRNIRFHALFFKLLDVALKAQKEPALFQTVEDLLEAVKIATGYTKVTYYLSGEARIVTKSISFAKMDELAFRAFFDLAVRKLCKCIAYSGNSYIEKLFYDVLKEPTPADLTR